MRYTVDESVFAINPMLKFGIIIGSNLKNSETMASDEDRLRTAEKIMRETYDSSQVRELPNVAAYRDVMTKTGINPNKYPPSVEAMFKRILKGDQLPVINALVDLCNAVSIEQIISLGAHDLQDIQEDLQVRLSKEDDIFLPFGAAEYEKVDKDELVFTSGNIVQTRKWIWRQSELGKTTTNSKNIIFQLVGFSDCDDSSLVKAMTSIEDLIEHRFQGSSKKYIVDSSNRSIDF